MKKYLFAALTILSCNAALAQDASQNLWIAGTQWSRNDGFTYGGVILPLEGSQLGQGAYQRHVLSHLHYAYDSYRDGENVRVRAQSPGLESALGYAWKGDRYTLDLSAGLSLRHLSFRPFVPDDERSGWQLDLVPQLQASYRLADSLKISGIAAAGVHQHSRFLRGRLAYEPESWSTGVQTTYLAGNSYRTRQYTAFAGTTLWKGMHAEISVGRSKPESDPASTIISLDLSNTF